MATETKCMVCGSMATRYSDRTSVFFRCPVCGRFELNTYGIRTAFDFNHLAAFLAYHRFEVDDDTECRYHTMLSKDLCDRYREAFEQGSISRGHPVHLDREIVETWYPKTFSERIDKILLYLEAQPLHVGQRFSLSYEEMISILFIDRYELKKDAVSTRFPDELRRDESECEPEVRYMLDYLDRSGLIEYNWGPDEDEAVEMFLTPEGYARVDELQKYSAYGRNVLVAMQFGDETIPLREAIRQGVKDAGYNAIFIDEVQHNEFITPELLKYIRDSKFVVVDLTHQNNGAYFEEGYAMGLGKPVIQLCQKDQKLHFDIAQMNTILWDTEEDIPERLTNRIKATID